MKFVPVLRAAAVLLSVTSLGMLSGCANYEVNTKRGNVPGYYIRYEMQEADRAVEAARQAGKDKICPAEFKAAEDAKNNAYDVFRACHTEEGAALAKQATAKANALCPPQAAVIPPPPAPAPETPKPPPAVPVPAPSDKLTITPASITKGQTASMAWSSQNATSCDIMPGVGMVQPQGTMTIAPAESTTYTLVCTGDGGKADSSANISVLAPPPVVEPAAKACTPPAINVHFDFDKSNIKPEYHNELIKLADFLKEYPNATGVIAGHTDSIGTDAYNMKLSQRRADSGRNYLVKKLGIAQKRLNTKAYGLTKPIADNSTDEGRAQNRRIEADITCSDK